MVANISIFDNVAEMAYVGKTPWHGLGQKLPKGAPIEVWAKEAGMSWEALKGTEAFIAQDNTLHQTDDYIIYRSDSHLKLGNCSANYKIVQPRDVLEFYEDLVSTQGWHIETAGCLDGGKRLWALAKTDGEISVLDTVDRLNTYLLLATSFDGTMATVGKFTSVRVVCQNTLTMSMGDGFAKVKIPHSRVFDAADMKDELGIYVDATKQLKTVADVLAKRKVNNKEAMNYIIKVLNGDDAKVDDLSTRSANIIKGVHELFAGKGMGATLKSSDGTAWGLLNSVTEYVDHHVNSRNVNNRLRSAWFGVGESVKNRAYEMALKMAA